MSQSKQWINRPTVLHCPLPHEQVHSSPGHSRRPAHKTRTSGSRSCDSSSSGCYSSDMPPNALMRMVAPPPPSIPLACQAIAPQPRMTCQNTPAFPSFLQAMPSVCLSVHPTGKCPVTQHCAGMKKLWKHIAECKDQLCQVPHCVSSRYVLSHYHRCRERGCAVCGPVREAIQRNHEKVRITYAQLPAAAAAPALPQHPLLPESGPLHPRTTHLSHHTI